MHQLRLNRVLTMMENTNTPQLLVADPAAIYYLTGKWIHPGERMLALFLTLSGQHRLFINELFPVPEDLGVEKVWFDDTQDAVRVLTRYVDKTQGIGVDKNWPSRFLLRLMDEEAAAGYVNGSGIIDRIRMCKDEEEIRRMREASRLNDLAMAKVIELLPNGYNEKEMERKLLAIYDEVGADGCSFDPIIAYGVNGTDPHHAPDSTRLREGDGVIIDIGCVKDSYCADMTRTVFYQKAPDKVRELYAIVREANERAIAAVKPGIRFCDVDAAARRHIEAAGYGKYFTHRTGHSIGLDVHDYGDVSAVNTDTLAPGMIFSIEPGIYLPGDTGVRIEDLVLVTEAGGESLNAFTKDLLVIG
ncbi:MAG TPA: Xaa-Pro peptidase family protein [Patescibacteria group bacterium]|nr:Xaa-Pro peptidase family protein [Patescibacteria group bacterium]